MKKKKIEIEIDVPSPGDALPFDVVRVGNTTIKYNEHGELCASTVHVGCLASAMFDIPGTILRKAVMDEAKGEVSA